MLVTLGGSIGTVAAWSAVHGGSGSLVEGSGALGSVSWPARGEAAVAIDEGSIAVSSDRPLPMASISKLVTALMILEAKPLRPGAQGDTFTITHQDDLRYIEAVRRGQSALAVPVGGTLTQYQLLEGMLIGSACNYADFLVDHIWDSNDAFVTAAASFLRRNHLDGITMVEPTGFDPHNTATPAALVKLGRLALADPIVAGIVVKRSVDLPGAGRVENTNDLLADPGTVGIKTGTLDGYNLLSARDVSDADGRTVRVFVVVMRQPTDDARFRASRALYDQVTSISGG